ncbi:MAG TPA: hypothetical protein VI959_01795 [Alphaproteobacteria bacterium]|nr:hypothetical protein [Alphaproteobacteria bacterium]
MRSIRDEAIKEGLNHKLSPDLLKAYIQKMDYSEKNISYRKLFLEGEKSLKKVQNLRENIGLSKRIFGGINYQKKLEDALRLYHEEITEKEHLENLERNQFLHEIIETDQTLSNLLKESEAFQKIEPPICSPSQALEESVLSITTLLPTIPEHKEEDYVFEDNYFQKEHSYHQELKKTKVNKACYKTLKL